MALPFELFPSQNSLSYGAGYTPFNLNFATPGSYTPASPTIAPVVAPTPAPVPLSAPTISTSGTAPVGDTAAPVAEAAAAAVDPTKMGFMDRMKSTLIDPKTGAFNLDGIASIGETVGTIGQLWGAYKGYQLAKDSLNFQKETFETNLGNQTKSYNTALEDRARASASATGASEAEIRRYVNKNKL